MKIIEVCSKGFGRKPRRLAPVAEQNQVTQPTELSPQSPPPRPAIARARSPGQKKSYGLELLHDGTDHVGCQDGTEVDIVAIHGLNGGAYSTWQHKNGVLWLKDLLPSDLPGARIYTYGYAAEILFSKSVADIVDYARGLLDDVSRQLVQPTKDRVLRPIIFVCHSLGGLVCKQALLLAKNEQKEHYEDILAATTAIVFLGTPHRGSKLADTAKTVGDFANALLRVMQVTGVTGAIRSDLVSALSADSTKLQALAKSFHDQMDHLAIVTFYERMMTAPLQSVVVDHDSAILGIKGEQVIPLNADHRSMCRFDARTGVYNRVVNQIRRLAREAKPNRLSAELSLKSTEKRCMSLLYSTNLADYKTQLPRPVQGTCSWILSDPQYTSWIKSKETGLLWVTGEPGCGKTMLSVFLTEHLSITRTAPPCSQVFYFFCDDKISTQRDAKEILRSILHQILQQHRRLIKYAKSRWEATGRNLVESFTALWEIFVKIVLESRVGPVGIIVDAIDECEADTRRTLLQAIQRLVHDSRTAARRPGNFVKFLLTSRPSPQDLSVLDEPQKSVLAINENQTRINQDIDLVIKSRFGPLAKRIGFSDATRKELEDLLFSRAEKSFLWLNIVLQSLESSLSTSKRDFKHIINNFPRQLEDTYASFLNRIPEETRDLAKDILRLLLGSARHLTLDEINFAYTVNHGMYRTMATVNEDRQNAIERMLLGIIGPLIRIEGSKVSLIHQSVKDFLIDRAKASSDGSVRGFGVSSSTAALEITSSCIRYLLLSDFEMDLFVKEPLPDPDESEVDAAAFVDPSWFGFGPALIDGPLLDYEEDLGEDHCSLIAGRYEFFEYAATHWAKHFAQCESSATKELEDAVLKLTKSKSHILKNWLKFFWIKTDMDFELPNDFDTFMVAAFFDCALLLKKCLREDVDQIKKDRALFWAARMGRASSTEVLLSYGANPNSCVLYLHTPLTIASSHGHLRTVRVLLADARTDVNAEGKSGRSALSFAAGNSHVEVFHALYDHEDCQVHHQDAKGWTSLFWAIERDHTTIARSLLRHAAVDINHVDHDGRSILSWAAGEGFLQALNMLLEHPKVEVNLSDSRGRTPLLWASSNGQERIIDALMQKDYGVERSSKDHDQRNALSLACGGGHTDTVKALLKYRCGGEDEEDASGWTPLAWALDRRSPPTVEALLASQGIQLDRQDGAGKTALIWAAVYGFDEVVRILLNQGSDPGVATPNGLTALDFARIYNHTQVVSLLEEELGKSHVQSID